MNPSEIQIAFEKMLDSLISYFPDYELVKPIPDKNWYYYFQNREDSTKCFLFTLRDEKFTISPRFIKTPHHSIRELYKNNFGNETYESPKIGFSVNRDVAQIAKGIKSRFIPAFDEYYSVWIKKWNDINDAENAKDGSALQIAKLLDVPDDFVKDCKGNIRESFCGGHSKNKSLKEYISNVSIYSGKSIEIKTKYLTVEQAKKLIEVIKGF